MYPYLIFLFFSFTCRVITRHIKYVQWIFWNVVSWVMTLSTVVTTNVVKKYTVLVSEFPENGGIIFFQNVGNHLQQTTECHNPRHHNPILHSCEKRTPIYTYTIPLWCRELL